MPTKFTQAGTSNKLNELIGEDSQLIISFPRNWDDLLIKYFSSQTLDLS